ncbi:MAG TPA: dipicolinate synthase subunit B [Bacillota bacterium]|nr:dipicolinate synthase subunit B [Bacillota bacterium]
MIGYAMCGSFCTMESSLEQLALLKERGYDIIPIMSGNLYNTDTRFGPALYFRERVEQICGRQILHTIVDVEPFGPQISLDALVICPCTGNSLAKIALGISDTSVTMAAKAHLRGNRPLVIALASNDALSANLKNIATLLARKHVFFVPMTQDDPAKKPNSLVADYSLVPRTLEYALAGKQYQKVFI